jgi:hypothetical protein
MGPLIRPEAPAGSGGYGPGRLGRRVVVPGGHLEISFAIFEPAKFFSGSGPMRAGWVQVDGKSNLRNQEG